jgi:ATP-dependent DNA helicase RecG
MKDKKQHTHISKNESSRIEHKRKLTDSFEKEVVAFLNYRDGGVIYIGIDDKTLKPVGLSKVNALQLKIKDRIKNNILPSTMGLFDVLVEKKDDKDIIKISIASGPEKPYFIKKRGMSEKGCFLRVGSASEPMPPRMVEDLFSRRVRNSISRIESPKSNLTFEQLKIYYDEAGFGLNDRFLSNLELLTPESKPNYAAYLLSDSNGISIKVAKYAKTDRIDLVENNEYGFCSLIKAAKGPGSHLDL